jgi:predicted transcriptional regulator
MPNDLDRALAVLGPLEGRIMRAIWAGAVPASFVVRDVQAQVAELAYTTVMTTVARLAEKGALVVDRGAGRQAHRYRVAGTPRDFLAGASAREAEEAVERYGDLALAAFAARLDRLSPERRERLRKLGGR